MYLKVIFAYLLVINLVGFSLMGIDKNRAINNEWRIPEKTLFLTAAAGGAPGVYAGMQVFRHKTKHPTFTIGIPAIMAVWIIVIGAYFYFFKLR